MNLADCGSATIAFSGKAGIGIAYVFFSLFSSVVFLRLGEAVRICYSCLCLNRSRVDDVLFHAILIFVVTGSCLAFKALFLSLVRVVS